MGKMIGDIRYYDENIKRIGILNQYDYATYTDYFDDIGNFEIHALMTDRNRVFLKNYEKDFYFQFNEKIFGRAKSIVYDTEGEFAKKIVIKGNLISDFFKTRVLTKPVNSAQKTIDILSLILYNEVTNSDDIERNVPLAWWCDDEVLDGIVGVRYQKSWGNIFTPIQELLKRDKLGFDLYPIMQDVTEDAMGNKTNLKQLWMEIFLGKNRTKGNSDGNKPIVFSTDLGNLSDSSFEISSDYERNRLYVAGEGEGNNRKYIVRDYVKSESDQSLYGLKLKEEYIDARDLQSEVDGETMTDEEYTELLVERADDKIKEYKRETAYESEIVTSGKKYVYGYKKDYYKGDTVTLIDTTMDLRIDTVVSGVTVTTQSNTEYLDLLFGDKKVKLIERLKV